MQRKIIFFDIDGTILSHRNYKISKSTITAIREARANGHLVFINTGRTFSEIDDEIKEVGFNGYVCGCGTYITYDSSVLFHKTLDLQTRQSIVQDLLRLKIDAVLEGNEAIFFNNRSHNEQLDFIKDMYQRKHFSILDWEGSDLDFDKFCIWINSTQAVNTFREKYKDQFDFISRDNRFLEVIPKGFSKATGIEYLLNHLSIPHENAYALGDSANDYTMLKYVRHSIGMGNSEEIIRSIVSYITKDVDDGGVEHALKHFCII
jgi:Cof subfamily protein (haloacid dehalogenase superfamily)